MTCDGGEPTSTVVTVEVAVLTVRAGRLHVLLVERTHDPHRGRWELPGQRTAAAETLDASAERAVGRVLGTTSPLGHLEQLRTYGAPQRHPERHVVSVAYVATSRATSPDPTDVDGSARFWAVEDLADGYGPPLAFDHEQIVADAVERLRAKLEYTTLAAHLVPDPFTVGDLYDAYRAVWGIEPGDKANFARKVKGTAGFLVESPTTGTRNGRGRRSVRYTSGPATRLHPPILRPVAPT